MVICFYKVKMCPVLHRAMALGQAVLEIIGLQSVGLRAHYFGNALVLGCYHRHKNLIVFSRAFVGPYKRCNHLGSLYKFVKCAIRCL
jgi:hypothetical protein